MQLHRKSRCEGPGEDPEGIIGVSLQNALAQLQAGFRSAAYWFCHRIANGGYISGGCVCWQRIAKGGWARLQDGLHVH